MYKPFEGGRAGTVLGTEPRLAHARQALGYWAVSSVPPLDTSLRTCCVPRRLCWTQKEIMPCCLCSMIQGGWAKGRAAYSSTLVGKLNSFHDSNKSDENLIKFPHEINMEPNHWIWFMSHPIWIATRTMERIKFFNRGTTALATLHLYQPTQYFGGEIPSNAYPPPTTIPLLDNQWYHVLPWNASK